MFPKASIRIIAGVIFLFCDMFIIHDTFAYANQGESIVYVIKPSGGRAKYLDLGLTDLGGRKVNLTVFETHAMGFKDTEKIYSDQETMLPIRVERDIRKWIGGENIVEEYDQKDHKVTIAKFKGKRKISEKVFSADGPIYNAILIPFYLRKVSDIKVGWTFTFCLPKKYVATLASIDEIRVLGKKFSAYHFISAPAKFEIWISKDDLRVPLKIKGIGGINYTLLMREHRMLSSSR